MRQVGLVIFILCVCSCASGTDRQVKSLHLILDYFLDLISIGTRERYEINTIF